MKGKEQILQQKNIRPAEGIRRLSEGRVDVCIIQNDDKEDDDEDKEYDDIENDDIEDEKLVHVFNSSCVWDSRNRLKILHIPLKNFPLYWQVIDNFQMFFSNQPCVYSLCQNCHLQCM